MTSYIRAHWCGAQPLAWSFWVNLVALTCIVLAFEWIAAALIIDNQAALLWFTAIYAGVFQLSLLVWQVVGVVRAGDRYYSSTGAMEWVWASHAGIVFSVVVLSISLFGSLQRVLINDDPGREIDADKLVRERASKYSFKIITIGSTAGIGSLMRLEGSFELGITRGLAAFLKDNPAVDGVVLSSNGGRIYEGRGIAALMQKHGITTYVIDYCNSACTTAFIGGKVRILGAKGKLGFHQYWHDAQLQHPFVDLPTEQEKDRLYYASRNISPQFLKRVFGSTHSDLWQPSHATLLSAGVVHKVMPPDGPL